MTVSVLFLRVIKCYQLLQHSLSILLKPLGIVHGYPAGNLPDKASEMVPLSLRVQVIFKMSLIQYIKSYSADI